MHDDDINKEIPLYSKGTSTISNEIYLQNNILTERDLFIKRFIERVDINNLKKHLNRIVKIRNPETGLENLNDTSNYISSVLNNYNLYTSKELFNFKREKDVLFNNVIAYKKGVERKKFFILSSHYDTVKRSPGADDNASAVVSLLEIARLISVLNLEYTVQFTFFTLEEYNMIGSIYHLKNIKKKNNRNIIGSFVLDGLAYTSDYQKRFNKIPYPESNKGDFLSVISNENSTTLLKLFTHNVNKYVPDFKIEPLIVSGNGETIKDSRKSDHSSFWDYGYKSLLLTDTAQFRNPNNHKMSDTIETLDLNFLYDSTKIILASTLDICLKR